MKRRLALATASLFALSAFAGPALAGSVGVNAGTEGGAGVSAGAGTSAGSGAGVTAGAGAEAGAKTNMAGDAATDQGATGAIGSSADVGSAVSAIGTDSSSQIGTMTDVSSVNVVKLSEIGAETEAKSQIDAAVEENAETIASLQAAIDQNASLKGELEAENVQASDVVAVQTQADGSLNVYVK